MIETQPQSPDEYDTIIPAFWGHIKLLHGDFQKYYGALSKMVEYITLNKQKFPENHRVIVKIVNKRKGEP